MKDSMTTNRTKTRRAGISIMARLIGLVRPLLPVMLVAITLGVLGYLCAIFLTIFAGGEILRGLGEDGAFAGLGGGRLFAALVIMAVMRGLLHYGEQYCNHYIAFRLLAIIRHKVFAKLRELCPAKLEGRDKGDLIAVITSDIELLEVFYAHTISPIAIGIITSLIMTFFIGSQYPAAGLLALAAYVTVGALIPLTVGSRGGNAGLRYRNAFADLNSYMLESLRGLDETIQYGAGEKRLGSISSGSRALGGLQKPLTDLEKTQRSVTNAAVIIFSAAMFFLMFSAYSGGRCSFGSMLTAVIAMMGSFGPVIALSNLANNLNQTLASGDRVLDLLEEEPVTMEVTGGAEADVRYKGSFAAECSDVSFSYNTRRMSPASIDGGFQLRPSVAGCNPQPAVSGAEASARATGDARSRLNQEEVLRNVSLGITRGGITGLLGSSGCGKSTLLRLLMRFWDAGSGEIRIAGEDIKHIDTASLRRYESCMTQNTCIFHDSIAANIAIGKPGATRKEIEGAARMASVHDFIMTLPDDYDTMAGELGDTLSGGEKQRIGLARAFLHDAPLMLLDEPTSNLDSLNEGMILRALDEARGQRTVVLVSHRASTLGICDEVINLENGRLS